MTPESFLLFTARSPHPSLLLSVDGRILAANDSAAGLIGRSPGFLTDRSLQEIATDDPADLERALRVWSTAGVAVGRPLRIIAPDGRHLRFRGEGLRVMTVDREPVARILLHCVPLDSTPRGCGGRPREAGHERPAAPAEPAGARETSSHESGSGEAGSGAARSGELDSGETSSSGRGAGGHAEPADTATAEPRTTGPGRVVGKMEAMGNLAAGIAHDFNNLLTVMKVEIELSQEHPGLPGVVVESLAATHDAIRQAEALVTGLLAFSRRQLVRVVRLDMRELIADGLERIRPEITAPNVDVVLEASPDPLPVAVDRAQMEAVLFALVRNARDAVRGSGRIRVRTRQETVDAAFVRRNPGSTEGSFAVLEVVDDGIGIPAEISARLFEPFFTTKGRGAGRGLGLAQAFGIVKALSGYLRVESTVGRGASFTVYLPLADAARAPRPDAGRA